MKKKLKFVAVAALVVFAATFSSNSMANSTMVKLIDYTPFTQKGVKYVKVTDLTKLGIVPSSKGSKNYLENKYAKDLEVLQNQVVQDNESFSNEKEAIVFYLSKIASMTEWNYLLMTISSALYEYPTNDPNYTQAKQSFDVLKFGNTMTYETFKKQAISLSEKNTDQDAYKELQKDYLVLLEKQAALIELCEKLSMQKSETTYKEAEALWEESAALHREFKNKIVTYVVQGNL